MRQLTSEQESRIPFYREKWARVGWDTTPCNREAAERYFRGVYQTFGIVPPECRWIASPIECPDFLMTRFLVIPGNRIRGKDLVCTAWDQIGGQFGKEFRERVWGQLGPESISQALNLFRDPVIAQVAVQHGDSLGHLWSESHHRRNFVLGCLGFLEFSLVECGIGDWERVAPVAGAVENCGWWIPYRDVVVLMERPAEIHLDGGRLHRDGGPAVRYRDGWSVWCLHGVVVPREVSETSPDQLDPQWVVRTLNVQVRREVVRKIGLQRVFDAFGAKVVESRGEYELLLLDLQDGRRRPYLKMRNPSTGEIHMEGVPLDCITVREALAWRNGTRALPVKLT